MNHEVAKSLTTGISKRALKITDMFVAHPPKEIVIGWNGKLPTVELTGHGDELCYLSWSGRLFRASEEWVRRCVDEFIEDYNNACRMSQADPSGMTFDIFSLNDLYEKFPILISTFGHAWGYNSDEDHAQNIKIDITRVYPSTHEIAARFGEPMIIIEPADDESYPDYYYNEY